MQKHQICNFVFDLLQTSRFDGPYHLRLTSYWKIERDKKVLEFKFMEGLFFAQMLNSNFLFNPTLE